MAASPAGAVAGPANRARPIARVVGIAAYLADLVILVVLAVRLLADFLGIGGGLVIGLLVVIVFAVAAGLSVYASAGPSTLLASFAVMYAVIAAGLVLWLGFDFGDDRRVVVGATYGILAVAFLALLMGLQTARIARLPTRRLAIPFLVVALILVLAAALAVVGIGDIGDRQLVVLGRILIALTTAGLAVGLCLAAGRFVSTAPGIAATAVRPPDQRP